MNRAEMEEAARAMGVDPSGYRTKADLQKAMDETPTRPSFDDVSRARDIHLAALTDDERAHVAALLGQTTMDPPRDDTPEPVAMQRQPRYQGNPWQYPKRG